MPPTPTFWMRQRQVKLEEAGPDTIKLTAPNLPAYDLSLQPAEGGLTAVLTRAGDAAAATQVATGYPDADHAWQVGFELYRQSVIT